MDRIELIDLCSVSRCGNDTISEGKESAMQESQDKLKHDETNKKVAELKTIRDEFTTKKDNVESAMMCWESTESLGEKEHREEPEKMANKLVETTEEQKHEEEHVKPTLNTGNRLKISIEEFSWEREGEGSTLGTEEPEQQEVVYITNLEDGLRKDRTALYNEKGPNEKKPAGRNRPIEVPSVNNPNRVFDIYGESDSDVNYIEDFSKGEAKKNSKENDYANMDLEKEGKQADLQELNTTQYHHDILTKVWILQGIYPLKDEWVFGCSLKTRLADQTKTQQLKWLWSKDSMNSTINQRLVGQTQEMNFKLEGSGGST